jgi:hypothetical protein
MKKTTLLTFAFIAITFASCKKDRVCTCTDVDGEVRSTTYFDSRKKDARLLCSEDNSQYKFTNTSGVTTTYDRTTCVLK